MTDDKHQHDEKPALDDAELAQDLEIKDAEEADAVKGGAADKAQPIYLKIDLK